MLCSVGILASGEGTTCGQALAMHPCFVLAAQRNPAFWLSPSSMSHAAFGQAVVHTQACKVVRALTEVMEMVTAFAGGGYVVLLTALCRPVGVLNLGSRWKYLRMVALSRGQVERARRWSDADVSEWSHVGHRASPPLSLSPMREGGRSPRTSLREGSVEERQRQACPQGAQRGAGGVLAQPLARAARDSGGNARRGHPSGNCRV